MKNRLLLLVAAAAIMITMQSCQKEPTACFTTDATSGTQANDPILFTNCTTQGHHYEWNFGDGQSSTDMNPTHTYAVAGVYGVTMTAYSENGKKTDEAFQSIPIAAATGKVSFWQSGTPAYYFTDVTIGSETYTISSDFPSGIFDCETSGTAYFTLPVGTYWYDAAEWSPYTTTWGGLVTVTQHGCTTVQLQ